MKFAPSATCSRRLNAKVVEVTRPSYLGREFIQIEQAAKYLDISTGTLHNWITRKRFTEADGLRRFGGSTRIHFPTLQARAMADELLSAG